MTKVFAKAKEARLHGKDQTAHHMSIGNNADSLGSTFLWKR